MLKAQNVRILPSSYHDMINEVFCAITGAIIGNLFAGPTGFRYKVFASGYESQDFLSSHDAALAAMLEHFNKVVWSVDLPSSHPDYPRIYLHEPLSHDPRYQVVLVDADKFMKATDRHHKRSYIVPHADHWEEKYIHDTRNRLNPRTGIPAMPYVHANERNVVNWPWKWPDLVKKVAEASYTNGRHRARYLHYAGATHFPVQTDTESAEVLREYCGAELTTPSLVQQPNFTKVRGNYDG